MNRDGRGCSAKWQVMINECELLSSMLFMEPGVHQRTWMDLQKTQMKKTVHIYLMDDPEVRLHIVFTLVSPLSMLSLILSAPINQWLHAFLSLITCRSPLTLLLLSLPPDRLLHLQFHLVRLSDIKPQNVKQLSKVNMSNCPQDIINLASLNTCSLLIIK